MNSLSHSALYSISVHGVPWKESTEPTALAMLMRFARDDSSDSGAPMVISFRVGITEADTT